MFIDSCFVETVVTTIHIFRRS